MSYKLCHYDVVNWYSWILSCLPIFLGATKTSATTASHSFSEDSLSQSSNATVICLKVKKPDIVLIEDIEDENSSAIFLNVCNNSCYISMSIYHLLLMNYLCFTYRYYVNMGSILWQDIYSGKVKASYRALGQVSMPWEAL